MSHSPERLAQLDIAFRAANYLGAAQIYLRSNVLLREALKPEHIKARLLGHWGTQPGLNLLYAHLNRLIQDTSAEMLFIAGPGHGAPAVLASLYLEGTLGEVYPEFASDEAGLTRFVKSFSFPGGLPSHVTALTPGAIHEGGELGYCLLHAFGAVFDNPGLIAACVIGDGEAETGPLAGSWHSPKFLNPATDGAVLPILHLNGYKLSGPSLLARMTDVALTQLLAGYGYAARIVAGDEPHAVHAALWSALDWAHDGIRAIQTRARGGTADPDPRWPAIVLRTPKGWTGPKTLDAKPIEGTFHAHQVPIEDPRTNLGHLAALEMWLRSYRPAELFDEHGVAVPKITALLPAPDRRMGRTAHAGHGVVADLILPDIASHAVAVTQPGATRAEGTTILGRFLADVFRANATARNFRVFCPDETTSNRLNGIFEATVRTFEERIVPTDEFLARDGRVMEILSEHCCEGWLEGYLQTGRHGLFACYEAFVSIVDSMMSQYAKWLKMSSEIPWRKPVASLNYLLTSHVWEQDHNGYSHQGPTFINVMMTKKSASMRIWLPPDANCMLAVMDHCLRSRDHVNLVVGSKKPQLQWLDLAAARAHCAAGAAIWEWAGTEGVPEVVLACCGDVPTRETLAAVVLLRELAPGLRWRVVNVVDLLCLEAPEEYRHGLPEERFGQLFTADRPVVFAFHGYPIVLRELLFRRTAPGRFDVHGYREEGTTTTPFDMLRVNTMSRYDLAIAALRVTRPDSAAIGTLERRLADDHAYLLEHGEDTREFQTWQWSAA